MPSGAGFDVVGQVGVYGLYFETPPGTGAVTSAGATGVRAIFEFEPNGFWNYWQQDDCTISFTHQGQPVPVDPPVATGRIWGHLSCPNALRVGTGDHYEPILEPNTECDAEADFLLENCNGAPTPVRPVGFPP